MHVVDDKIAFRVGDLRTTLQQVVATLQGQIAEVASFPKSREHIQATLEALDAGDQEKAYVEISKARQEVSSEHTSPKVRALRDRMEQATSLAAVLSVVAGDEVELSASKVQYLINGDLSAEDA